MTNTDKFIDIYKCDKLYNIYDEKISNVLKSIKIDFRTETDYDIFVNDEKYINKKNNKHILSFIDVNDDYNINSSDYIFCVKTNCNFVLNLTKNIEYDDTSYPLFDGYTNSIDDRFIIDFCKKKIKVNSVYMYLYFYKYNWCFLDYVFYTKKDNFIYFGGKDGDFLYFGEKMINDYELYTECYIDFTKYILISTSTKYIDKYYNIDNNIDNNIIKIELYETTGTKNPFDIICSINILQTYDNYVNIILTPIKIIDNSSISIINIYNNCEKCKIKYNDTTLFNRFYSKNILQCDKHKKEFKEKLKYIFGNEEYYMKQSNIIHTLNKELSISINIKYIKLYS